MPEKDFTDYVCLILEAKKRVYHIIHVRSTKDLRLYTFNHNGHSFIFDRDRAFLLRKWRPWKKVNMKHPLWTLNELLRSKKVGLLLYHEPVNPKPLTKEIEHKTPKEYVCKECAGFSAPEERPVKIHLSKKHKVKDYDKHIRIEYDVQIEKQTYYAPIHPIHISRVHQPSGRLIEAPSEVKAAGV